MLRRRIIIIAVVVLLVSISGVVLGDDWMKVNDSNAIDNGEPLSSADIFCSMKNGQGDLLYIYQYGAMGPVAGRFGSGGDSPTKKWEVYTDGGWSNEANAIPTSISHSIAQYSTPVRLFALPDSNEGVFGMASRIKNYYSTRSFNMHGYPINIMYDETNGWRQWKGGASYEQYYIDSVVYDTCSGNSDFAFDPNSKTGILVGVRRSPQAYNPTLQLTATKYVHEDASEKWHRWDNNEGDWLGNNDWPSTSDTSPYILNPSPDDVNEYFHEMQVAHLGSGDYLAAFGYTDKGESTRIVSAARYEGSDPNWSWWGEGDWEEGGDYDYNSLADGYVYKTMEIVEVNEGVASLFYLDGGDVYEITYDETGVSPPLWGSASEIAAAGDFSAVVDVNSTIWLFYTQNDTKIYLRQKVFGGSWGAGELIYSSQADEVDMLGANFVGDDEVPICFMVETEDDEGRIYAISDSDCNSYWAGEDALALDAAGETQELDHRVLWQNQVLCKAPDMPYGASQPSHLAIDEDGYLYAPLSANCSTVVQHKDETSWNDANSWGRFWDHFRHPGGCAVDNTGGNVYIADCLIQVQDIVGVTTSWIRKFDMNKRTESIGYREASALWNREYSPQQFGSAKWPGDVAVDEEQGLLYLISSSECKVKVYDIENTVDKTGAGYRFRRSYLESGFYPDDLVHAQNIVDELIFEANDPNIYLIEYASDPNYVHWDANSEDLDTTITFVKDLNDFNELSSDVYRDRFVRQLSFWYKYYWDVPVELSSSSFGSKGDDASEFRFPQGIDTDASGNIYVTDTGNHRIQKFDPNGDFIMSWGTLGYGEGEFIYPYSVATDPNYNLVYVTDPFNYRLQIFDSNGKFIYTWGSWDSTESDKEFSHTYGVVADGDANIFIGVEEYIAKFSILRPDVDVNDNGVPDTLEGGKMVIYAAAEEGSSITPSGYVLIDPGDDQSFTIDINEGECALVFVDGISKGNIASYTFYDIDEHHTIKVLTGNVKNIPQAQSYDTIQEAIDNANDGDEIEVCEGTYYENIDFKGKAITVRSKVPEDWSVVEATIIDANGSGTGVRFHSGEDSNSVLKGFTIRNGGDYGYGIECSYGDSAIPSPTISNCIISNNDDAGIYCFFGSPIIINNKIFENDNYGIRLSYVVTSVYPVIKMNWIYANGKGIECSSSTIAATIRNNTIVGNDNRGIRVSSGTAPSISNCILWDNGDDLDGCSATYSCIQDGDAGTGNISSDPCFADADSNDYHLIFSYDSGQYSPCMDAGDPNGNYDGETDIDGQERAMDGDGDGNSVVDMGADEVPGPCLTCVGDLDVNSVVDLDDLNRLVGDLTWAYIYTGEWLILPDDPQTAYLWKTCSDMDQDYDIDLDDYNSLLSKLLDAYLLYGEYEYDCGDPLSFHFYVSPDGSDNNDGLSWATAFATIQHGLDVAGNTVIVEVNEGEYYETIDFDGVSCTVTSTDPNDDSVVRATIINANGAGYAAEFSSGEDANSVLTGFTVTGGSNYGVYCSGSSPVITRCRIEGNTDGIYISDAGSAPAIKNNLIYDNEKGITFGNANSGSIVCNNTIVGNTTSGIYKTQGNNPSISNCVVWNCNDDLYNCSATYSCIEDGDGGEGNISGYPLFVDVNNDNYRLDRNSPCVDAGNGNTAPATDMDGQVRIDIPEITNTGEGTPNYTDIGAYETDTDSPMNTTCETAKDIEVSTQYTGSTVDAADGVLWFRFEPQEEVEIDFVLCNSDFDTTITVYFAEDCGSITGEEAFNNDSCGDGTQSRICCFEVEAESDIYYIKIAGNNGARGNYELELCEN